MMISLGQLTLVIPTFKRPEFIFRQVEHWRSEEINLLILDGSPEPAVIPTGGKSKVRYIHSPAPLPERLAESSQLVSTPFVALSGDDDLYTASGLRACISELLQNPEVVGCVGPSLRFRIRNNRVYAQAINSNFRPHLTYERDELTRLAAIFDEPKIENSIYGVYRKSPWTTSMRTAYSRTFATGNIHEFLLANIMRYLGPVSMVSTLTRLASAEIPSIIAEPGFDRRLDVVDWLTSAEFRDEVEEAKRIVAKTLHEYSEEQAELLREIIEQNFVKLLQRYVLKRDGSRHWSGRKAATLVLPYLPGVLKDLSKAWIPSSLLRLLGLEIFPLEKALRKLESQGIGVDRSEILFLAESILASYKRPVIHN